MLRVSTAVLALLLLAGCFDSGGGGGGGGDDAPAPAAPVTDGASTAPGAPAGAPNPPNVSTPPVASGAQPPAAGESVVAGPPLLSAAPPPPAPVQVPELRAFPEPVGAVVDELGLKGFYDRDKTGAVRAVRNDLSGSLPAMVQFVQGHSVDPSGNAAKNMPRLTAEKEAMLLVTPDPALSGIDSVSVEVLHNGARKGVLQMRHPDQIFRSDYNNGDGRPDYVYSRRAWSAVLPWDWVTGEMELRVTDNQGRVGALASADIEIAPPGELLMQSIRMGMLTTPVGCCQYFRDQPAQAATDYLQTIPAAKIVASYYEDISLPRVMVASGVIYDTVSAGDGNVYGGDMRENTGKATFSVGINLANWGVSSSAMQAQNQPQLTQSVVAHHNRGVYQNGTHSHGLSGGNSILTLYSSSGNEYSHEIGHHYGLGHFPGQSGDNYFWSGHHHDSGWGYMSHRKRMRANIHWWRGKNDGMSGQPVLDDTYSFGTDAMAGGHYSSSLSSYTHYTGYSTKIKIQDHFDRAMWSEKSPTGYVKWNAATKKMEEHSPSVPTNQAVNWFNSVDGKFLRPRLFGVPVVTLLGGYDPDTGKALMYPALRGNWGYVYDLPQEAYAKTEPRACWITVSFLNGTTQKIAISGRRLQNNLVNKFHVNLAQAEKPKKAEMFCQTPGQDVQAMYTLEIPTDLPAMPAAVVVGKEAGISALRATELPSLQAALEAVADNPVPVLSGTARVQYESHAHDLTGLSSKARTAIERIVAQESKALRLNRWLDKYGSQLAGSAEARAAFTALITQLGFPATPVLPDKRTFTRSANGGDCIKLEAKAGGGWNPYVLTAPQCTGGEDEQWMLDPTNRIRSVAQPTQCLTHGGSVSLTACNLRADAQVWEVNAPVYKRGNSCMDLNKGFLTNGRGDLIGYGCTGGGNQKWYGLTNNGSSLITMIESRNIAGFMSYANAVSAVASE